MVSADDALTGTDAATAEDCVHVAGPVSVGLKLHVAPVGMPDLGFCLRKGLYWGLRGAGAQTGKSKSSGRASRQSLAFDVSFRIVCTDGFGGFRKPGLDFNEF
jgi:hypothetical protein